MGQSYTSLSKEYGLGKSTIHDIVQSEDRLTEYAMEIQHASGPKRSIIRRSKGSTIKYDHNSSLIAYYTRWFNVLIPFS